MRFYILLVAMWASLFGVAQAATLNETDFAGGFSSNELAPTVVAGGFETVTGTIDSSEDTFLHFTNLAVGAQQLDFTFGIPASAAAGFGSVGEVEVSQVAPTAAPTEGTAVYLLGLFGLAPTTTTLSFNLDTTFAGGDLYVSILPTFSAATVSFGVEVPGNAPTPAPVPVPAAGLMLLAALGGFAALRRRKPDMVPA